MSTAPSLVYTTNAPRSGSRAKAAKHTEAAGKRELPWIETWYSDEKPAFNDGEEVMIVDDEHIHYKRTGKVSKHLGGKKYIVKMPWSGGFLPFQKSQLVAVPKKAKPKRKRKDKFSCAWGVCELSRHPDIPKRWAARNIPSGDVICIEPTPEYIAHQKFLAFLETVDKPRYTRHELHTYIAEGMERRARERLEVAA